MGYPTVLLGDVQCTHVNYGGWGGGVVLPLLQRRQAVK